MPTNLQFLLFADFGLHGWLGKAWLLHLAESTRWPRLPWHHLRMSMNTLRQLHYSPVVFLYLLYVVHHLLLVVRDIIHVSHVQSLVDERFLSESNAFLKWFLLFLLICKLCPIESSVGRLRVLLDIFKLQPESLNWWFSRLPVLLVAHQVLIDLDLLEHFWRLLKLLLSISLQIRVVGLVELTNIDFLLRQPSLLKCFMLVFCLIQIFRKITALEIAKI